MHCSIEVAPVDQVVLGEEQATQLSLVVFFQYPLLQLFPHKQRPKPEGDQAVIRCTPLPLGSCH